MTNEEVIKPIYSDITINILEKERFEYLLKESHRLRAVRGYMNKPDSYVLISALRMYKRYYERILRSRAKRQLTIEKKAQKDAIATTNGQSHVMSGGLICQ